ncbi:MAG: hypothetical protein ACXWC9_05860, partial [Pseudobdellovibrionaceae bacterium]
MNRWVVFLILFLSLGAEAVEKNNESLPAVMHSFYGSLSEMKPFMMSFEEYKDAKNKAKILGILRDLQTKIETTQVRDLGAPGFQTTYDLLGRHLKDTAYLYEKEIYDSSWIKFRSTTQFCIACHDRLPKTSDQFKWSSSAKPELKDFD